MRIDRELVRVGRSNFEITACKIAVSDGPKEERMLVLKLICRFCSGISVTSLSIEI